MQYPYWIIITSEGVLPCPVQYKHTLIERQFKSGRLGGKKTTEQTAHSKAEALQFYQRAKQQDKSPEVYIVESNKHARRRVQFRELNSIDTADNTGEK
jgi:hypothetical protein